VRRGILRRRILVTHGGREKSVGDSGRMLWSIAGGRRSKRGGSVIYALAKWFACPCIGPTPPTCHMSYSTHYLVKLKTSKDPNRRNNIHTQHVTSHASFDPTGYEIRCSVSYLATRYCSIAPLSQILISCPSSSMSVSAGIRPLGFIARNQGSFCSFCRRAISRVWTDC
jgi:hypothetical protein